MKKSFFQRGFTLLELLVVISIIGILIAMGAAAFSTAQKKSRDARRRGDMKTIQNAFEQYYANNGSTYAACNTMASSTYLPGGMPVDPQTQTAYTCTATATTYCVCATLEDTTAGNSTNTSCAYGTGSAYCASNLQ
ncbi:MAG TPA: type II secretion system protein [Vitreimonas sp.]|nr:type II secretion system protein [Vitreimonas sp.]